MTGQNAEIDAARQETLEMASGENQEERSSTGMCRAPGTRDAWESQASWLATIFGRLKGYFVLRANAEDMAVLGFCLHHLFFSVDTLYRGRLRALAAYPSCPPGWHIPGCDHSQRWTHLQEIKRLLERIEPLCQLLNGATTNMLGILDALASPSAPAKPHKGSPLQCHGGSWQAQSSIVGAIPCGTLREHPEAEEVDSFSIAHGQEEWERAVVALTAHLDEWQRSRGDYGAFSQFSEVLPGVPVPAQIDSAFERMLENARAIFGDILLDFQGVSLGDDEAVATLLLDLMQKADLILLHIDVLMGPLHVLIKQHAPGAEMH